MPVPGTDGEVDVIVDVVEALKRKRVFVILSEAKNLGLFCERASAQADGQRCFAPLNMTEENA